MQEQIDKKDVKAKYLNIDSIWESADSWHKNTFKIISKFINDAARNINGLILNAGSGGYSYGLNETKITHIDICEKNISLIKNSVIGNIEDMPFSDAQFDFVLCVGSVINYCDPIIAFSEFNRVLRKKGQIILEFENSNTLELIGTRDFNKKIVLRNTFFHGSERLYYLSEKWVKELALINDMSIVKKYRFHILSAFFLRITSNINFANWWQKFDCILQRCGLASNTILWLKKNE